MTYVYDHVRKNDLNAHMNGPPAASPTFSMNTTRTVLDIKSPRIDNDTDSRFNFKIFKETERMHAPTCIVALMRATNGAPDQTEDLLAVRKQRQHHAVVIIHEFHPLVGKQASGHFHQGWCQVVGAVAHD